MFCLFFSWAQSYKDTWIQLMWITWPTPPTLNPKIFPKLKQITTRNLAYLSGQQFRTMCNKLCPRSLYISREWRQSDVIKSDVRGTSEWRPPISTKNKGLRKSPPRHARAFTSIGRHNPKTRICAKCFAFAFPKPQFVRILTWGAWHFIKMSSSVLNTT